MSVGGPKLHPNTFIENGLEKIRASLKYLLYGVDPLEERFYNFTTNPENEYRLRGVGRAFASTALLLIDSQKYGIWNSTTDGGLKELDLLPQKERREHQGQTYVKVVGVLQDIQQRCGFEDLSLVDEFVQLIYNGVIKIPEGEEDEGEDVELEVVEEEKDDTHLRMQWVLKRIGLLRGYDVWVAANDRNKEYSGEKLGTKCLEALPHFAGPAVLKIAQSIDVIWFRKRAAQPEWFFEIEHTTPIYSGLLRLNDVKIDYPIPRATIVSSPDKRSLYENQIKRRTFEFSELVDVCRFMDYRDVEKWFGSEKTINEIKRQY